MPQDQPPTDQQSVTVHDGLRYDADLLALAAQTPLAAGDLVEVTG